MADEYTTLITSPNEVEVGQEVKVTPSNAMFEGMPMAMRRGMRMDPKMGKIKTKKDKAVIVDIAGMEMEVAIPPVANDFFKWDLYKKKVGGKRRSASSKKRIHRTSHRTLKNLRKRRTTQKH